MQNAFWIFVGVIFFFSRLALLMAIFLDALHDYTSFVSVMLIVQNNSRQPVALRTLQWLLFTGQNFIASVCKK